VLYLAYRRNAGLKLRTKREADAVARFLADHGYPVEWVRRNYGAQREMTWNVRLSDGGEIHNRQQLADMGFTVRHATAAHRRFHGAPDYGVNIGPAGGRWTVGIAWMERGKPASISCGHRHLTREAAWRCAGAWRRRVRSEIDRLAE
jgi:hypothetical protein